MSDLKKKILLVEDDPALSQMYSDKLVHEGFRIVISRDGEEGLALAVSEKPDLILLDLMLPKLDGMSLLEKLRDGSLWGSQVPVIILTNLNADDKVIKQVITDKPAYYLMKANSTPQGVIDKIREILNVF